MLFCGILGGHLVSVVSPSTAYLVFEFRIETSGHVVTHVQSCLVTLVVGDPLQAPQVEADFPCYLVQVVGRCCNGSWPMAR